MSSNSTLCAANNNLCSVTQHQLAVIIVPALLFAATLLTLLVLLLKVYCPDGKRRTTRVTPPHNYHSSTQRRTQHTHRHTQHTHRHTQPKHSRRNLQGIDAPVGINPLEHEELPMQQNVRPTLSHGPRGVAERPHGAFSQITALPKAFSIQSDGSVSLYRASMDNRAVILHVLKDAASSRDKQHFLSFASFLSGLGPHPFLPELMGVVSVRPPLMMVVEELQQRDLLGFLWRCRQSQGGRSPPCELTEKGIVIMAGQVASALVSDITDALTLHLHAQGCVHGNVGARSVLLSGDLTAKLWGLGPAHRRRTWGGEQEEEELEMKKWQAPEVLAGRAANANANSDVWSFGVLLYEMVTLGDAPFAEIRTNELLQHLQRGAHLRQPPSCSSSLYAVIKSCCRWTPQDRPSLPNLISKLQTEEASANLRTAIRVPQPMDFEKYLREAGFGENLNYAVL